MCVFYRVYEKPGCYKKDEIIGTKIQNEKNIVCMACHRYRLNSDSFLDRHGSDIQFKFFTQNNCFNNLFALYR